MSKKKKSIPYNEQANQAVNFINCLTGSNDYSDQPIQLRDWQEEIIRQLFGTLDEKGKRKIRRAFIMLGRGNGKTALTACIVLYALVCFSSGQQIYSCASDREQASNLFNMVAQMVRADSFLSSICTIVPSKKRVVIEGKNSFYCALAADAHRQHGLSPSLCIYDEMHCAKNADLMHAMQTGLDKRKNSLFIGITTAGVYDPTGEQIATQEYNYAKKVQSGEIKNENYLPVLFELDKDDDFHDENNWCKANPALNDFLPIEGLREQFKIALEIPSRMQAFKQYHLNIFSQQSSSWLNFEQWNKCGETTFDPDELLGKECYAGLDIGPVNDLTSMTLFFPMEDGTFKVLSFNWCNADDIESRSKRDKAPYDLWQKQNFLTMTEGNATDFNVLRRDINEICSKYAVKNIATDPFNAYQLVQQLSEQDGLPVEYFRQGFISQSAPTQELERLVITGKLNHNNNPVLSWCAGNVVIDNDTSGNIKISKKKSTEKIDAIAALVNAIGVYLLNQTTETESVYQSQGIDFF